MQPLVIIACAGNRERWAEHLGVPKQLSSVAGERILDRTVRQSLERGARVVVSGPQGDERFRIPGTELAWVEQNAEWYGTARYYATRDLWSLGRTIILHGDVRFTDDAMDTIFAYDGDWNAFVRCGPSIGGKPHSEVFGVSFTGITHAEFKNACQEVAHLRHTSVIRRAIGFECWRYMAGIRGSEIECRLQTMPDVGRCTHINDLTDDIDDAEDHSRMIYQLAAHAPVTEGVTSVVIPWRETDDPMRRANYEWLVATLAVKHPDWEVSVAGDDRPGQPWNKAAAWLNAVTHARGDVLVLLDADVWSDQLAEAVARVRAGETEWVQPHNRVHRLNLENTQGVLRGNPWQPGALERMWYTQQVGAVPMILTRRLFLEVPPDQRFEGWGWEDTAWGAALETLHGSLLRMDGDAIHLYHAPDPIRAARQNGNEIVETEEARASDRLWRAYDRAKGDRARMVEIAAEARCSA